MSTAQLVNQLTKPVLWQPWQNDAFYESTAVFRYWLADGGFYDQSILTADELARARRYHRSNDRQRFCTARYLVKMLLSQYTKQHPAAIRIVAGANGKPELEAETGWFFNVSHSGKAILIAIGKRKVGVDIEEQRPDFMFRDLLPGSFSLAEQQFVNASADSQSAFYQLWTRKEALLKATASGLVNDLSRIPALDGTHTVDGELIGAAGHWIINSFNAFDGYAAAVAYDETMPTIPQFYTLDDVLPGW